MWTSTRTDMVHVHWVPNHFIPVLPIDVVHKPSDIEIQRWRLKAQRTKEKVKTQKDTNNNGMFKSAEEKKKTEHQESFLEKNTELSRRKTAPFDTSEQSRTPEHEKEIEEKPSDEEPNKDIPHPDATYQHDEKSKEPDDDEFKGYTSSDDLLHKYVIVL